MLRMFRGLAPAVAISCGAQLGAYSVSTFGREEPTEHYYDLSGAATHLAIAAHAVASSRQRGAMNPRVVLMATLSSVWALRLGGYLYERVQRVGGDERFATLKRDPLMWAVPWAFQAVWCFALQAPLAIVASTGAADKLMRRDVIGAAIFIGGLAFEWAADAQKDTFKREHKTEPMMGGLFAYSVYAIYFGECSLWWGQFLLAAPAATTWPLLAAASAAPLVDCLLIWAVSGIPMAERSAWRKYGADPTYLDYRARTSLFWPLPPKLAASPEDINRVRQLAAAHAVEAPPSQTRPPPERPPAPSPRHGSF